MTVPQLSYLRIIKQLAMDADLLRNFHARRNREEVLKAFDQYARFHGEHPVLTSVRRYILGQADEPRIVRDPQQVRKMRGAGR
jgi:hypothetical protein